MTGDAPGERGPDGEAGVGASLRTFSLRILVGTVLAAAVVVLALRWWSSSGERARPRPGQGGEATAAPSASVGERVGVPPREGVLPDSQPVTAPAREVERRHAAGALSEAQKRFDRCPGGDLRRLAWIDPRSGVVKLVREREDGVMLEEWFDDEGRLREALWRGRTAAGIWGGRLAVAADGRETAEQLAGGVVPDAAPPPLDRRDPTAAFFASPACPR